MNNVYYCGWWKRYFFCFTVHRSFIKRRRKKEGPSCFDVCWGKYFYFTIVRSGCMHASAFLIVVGFVMMLLLEQNSRCSYMYHQQFLSSMISKCTTIIVPNWKHIRYMSKKYVFHDMHRFEFKKTVFHAYSTRIPCVTLMMEPQQIIYSASIFLSLLYRSNQSIKLIPPWVFRNIFLDSEFR